MIPERTFGLRVLPAPGALRSGVAVILLHPDWKKGARCQPVDFPDVAALLPASAVWPLLTQLPVGILARLPERGPQGETPVIRPLLPSCLHLPG